MVEKAQVKTYARARKLKFLEDPSNKKTDIFRNWVRRWLKELDRRQPNGTRNMARSFARLAEELEGGRERALTDGGIDRKTYSSFRPSMKRRGLARYCNELGVQNYTQGHIEELVKRLDVSQKSFTFKMLHCVWSVTPDRIKASRMTSRV
jgi:tRNA(Ile)-lysidine synthase TilS/MesJ